MEVKTASEKETQEIAQKLAGTLKKGDIICLYGELGAGKTVFVRGVASGLGIKKRLLSPTFVLMRTYPFEKDGKNITLYHLDLYRTNDFKALGLDEIFESGGITIIEWAEKIKDFLPQKKIDVKFEKVNETTRRITISRSNS